MLIMIKPIKILTLIVSLSMPFFVKAEGGSMSSCMPIGRSHGFLSNQIHDIAQDNDGLLWFATGYGLSSFDGHRVTNYFPSQHSKEQAIDNEILSVSAGQDNVLYFGTRKGFGLYNKYDGEFQFPSMGDAIAPIECICQLRSGEILIGAENGLMRYNPDESTLDQYYNGEGEDYPNHAIKSVFEDKLGQIWIGTWDCGIYRYSPTEQKYYHYPKLNRRNSAHVIFQDNQGDIWVGIWDGGLQKLVNPYDMALVSTVDYLPGGNARVYTIAQKQDDDNLWIGTGDEVCVMDTKHPGVFRSVNFNDNLSGMNLTHVDALKFDSHNNIWIGSYSSGPYMIKDQKPLFDSRLPMNDVYTRQAVNSIFCRGGRKILVGVAQYGIFEIDAKTDDMLGSVESGESLYSVGKIDPTSILCRGNGELWFSVYGEGLCVKYPDGEVKFHVSQTIAMDNLVVKLYEDSQGNVWVGSRNGLSVRERNGEDMIIPQIKGEVVGLAELDGRIWVATADNPVYCLTPAGKGGWNITEYDNLMSNGVRPRLASMYISSDKNVYLGTEGYGLLMLKDGQFEMVQEGEWLKNNRIRSIIEDNHGHLWLGTNNGLWRWSISDESHRESVLRFSELNGLPSNFFTSAVASDGENLYFGTERGYVKFNPVEVNKRIDESPRMKFGIVDFVIDSKPFLAYDKEDRGKFIACANFTDAKKVTLPYDRRSIAFELANFSLFNPGQVQYAYKLEGYDNDWHYLNAPEASIKFAHLTPGSYTLRIKAFDENGVPGDERAIEIFVKHPWFATWIAYLCYVMIVMAIAWFIIRYFRRREAERLKIKRLEMERKISEDSNQMKLDFFTNITHEFLTPLTVISAGMAEIRNNVSGYDVIFNSIDLNVKRLMKMLQQVLEFRKAESKSLKLRVSYGNIISFVENEVQSLIPLFNQKGMKIEFNYSESVMNGYFDPDKLDKILYNLLSNASKYCNKEGLVWVNLSRCDVDDAKIVLQVSDNGPGIPKEKQATLFQRFYEGEYREFKTIGTGIGLSLTKELVEIHHGTITVESEVGKGTTFTVVLPVSEQEYDDSEKYSIRDNSKNDAGDASDFSIIPPNEPDDAASDSGRPLILIVEDEPSLLQMLQRILSNYYRILTAHNGDEAIEQLSHNEINLIVTDVVMEGVDGLELSRRVKSDLATSHIPVLALTAKRTAEDITRIYEAGVDAYLAKPFNVNVLLSRIDNLLEAMRRRARLFRKQLVFNVNELELPSADMEFMERAVACVNRHISDSELDVASFASHMGMSKNALYQKLKKITEMSPNSFIKNIRLKTACSIMDSHPEMRISEVAYAVGFNDPKYFSITFHKEFGITPREYMSKRSGNMEGGVIDWYIVCCSL